MGNITIYPYGTDGELPSSIGLINDLYTGGADKALTAEMGKMLNESINTITEIDLSDYEDVSAFILNDGTWLSGSNTYKCKFIPVEGAERYIIQANTDSYSSYTVLTSNSHDNGAIPDFCNGWSKTNISGNSYHDILIPSDGKYLYVATYSTSDITPNSLKKVESKIGDVDFESIMLYNIDVRSQTPVRAYPANTGKWVNESTNYPYYGIFIPCRPKQNFEFISTKIVRYCFLTTSNHVNNTNVDYATGYSGNPSQKTSGISYVTAPSDAHCLYVVVSLDGLSTFVSPSEIRTDAETVEQIVDTMSMDYVEERNSMRRIAHSFGNTFRKLSYDVDGNGYETPDTLQVLNVQRKAAQFSDIQWTPKGNIPNCTGGNFISGRTYTGIPYSNTKELDKEIGFDVSIHTFMTAVNNPYSLLYTENVSAANSRSAWGKTYHGIAGYVAPYYGTVCTVVTAESTGYDYDYISTEYKWLDDTYRAVKIHDQSAQGLCIGDIVWKSGHCRVVTGIKRDTDGSVLRVEITEAIETNCRRLDETASAFNERLASEGGIIYRPLELYKNTDYAPSPYVAVMDELPQSITYNNDICCFAGDKATFREGDTIAINYNLQSVGSWTGMELYKNNNLVETISVSSSEHVVDLTSKNLTYGKYKARMTNGTVYSDYTYFEILKTNVSFVVDGHVAHISFSSDGQPLFCRIGTIGGAVYAQYLFTEEDIKYGEASVDFVKLNKEQGFVDVINKTGALLKVFFVGDYGRVTNEPVSILFT